jgi:hypothetical protein
MRTSVGLPGKRPGFWGAYFSGTTVGLAAEAELPAGSRPGSCGASSRRRAVTVEVLFSHRVLDSHRRAPFTVL